MARLRGLLLSTVVCTNLGYACTVVQRPSPAAVSHQLTGRWWCTDPAISYWTFGPGDRFVSEEHGNVPAHPFIMHREGSYAFTKGALTLTYSRGWNVLDGKVMPVKGFKVPSKVNNIKFRWLGGDKMFEVNGYFIFTRFDRQQAPRHHEPVQAKSRTRFPSS